MKKMNVVVLATFLVSAHVLAGEYNLGELAKANKLELFNRSVDQARAESPEVLVLDARPNDGLAWISGLEFSQGTIELQIRGKNLPGQSFVGVAFHGQGDQAFDAIYLRPFNFQSPEASRRNHSIQYISIPEHNWNTLRQQHPGKYESAIAPAPDPESWVKLRLVIEGTRVSAFVNGSAQPSLTVELLGNRSAGKIGLWVGNGSGGWFRNLSVTPSTQQ